METTLGLFGRLRERYGVVAVVVAVLIVVLIGFAAFAIDIGHLYVVRGELQNAADAGALAGARVLFAKDADGNEIVNTDANQVALDAAIANRSDKTPVEVDLGNGNDLDVQRGHWDPLSNSFVQSDSLDTSFINAVKVATHRSAASSFFARIFGFQSFPGSASAVAHRSFAGEDVKYDQPIAICKDKIVDADGNFLCTKGRMIHSGNQNPQSVETGRWTNFSEGCAISANKPNVTDLVCGDIEPISITSISTINGEVQPSMDALYNCWLNATKGIVPWDLTLPVVECVTPVTCSKIVGAVHVRVVWVTDNGNDPQFNNIPVQMEGWENGPQNWSRASDCSGYDLTTKAGRELCWNDFVNHFNIIYIDSNGLEQPAVKVPVSLYFVPDCNYDSFGGPGGEEFNVHALYPKLVQ